MPTQNVISYSISNNEALLGTATTHNLQVGTYISVRNVNSLVNGQYTIKSVPFPNALTYDIASAPDTSVTVVSGKVISTTINSAGKPGYIYDEPNDTWYQISGKVNTNGNYTWTGTHLHEAPVTLDDLLILNNISASVSSSPVGGGYLFVQNGALKFKGGNGTITTVAPA